jgi:phospholipid/cholesterol/gamma-HCH transport system permease protein
MIRLAGTWTLASLMANHRNGEPLRRALRKVEASVRWNLLEVERLDSAAAVLLWQSWGYRWPAALQVSATLRATLERVAAISRPPSPASRLTAPPADAPWRRFVLGIGQLTLNMLHNLVGLIELHGRLTLDLLFLLRHPREMPWKEFSANIYKAGARALPVLALMGFLIGVTISYLSALQLKMYGADLFIINLLGLGIIRELGPVLVAVLVAGRSGSAMTAQIGVMRVTEEIDALATLGISRTLRVVLPKVAALTVVMPLLVVWTSVLALVGGAFAAWLQLDLSPVYFFSMLPKAVPLANLWIGLVKGMVFGFLVALLACQFGLHVRPNTESLSARTTAAVVTAITLVIIVDALFAVLTRGIGLPG